PVTDRLFERIKKGEVQDNSIEADDLALFNQPGPLLLYLCSVATSREVDKANVGLLPEGWEKLFSALCDKLTHYIHQGGGHVAEMVSVAWTPQGKKICAMFGMKCVANDKFGNPVYWGRFEPDKMRFARVCSAFRRLVAAYKSRKKR